MKGTIGRLLARSTAMAVALLAESAVGVAAPVHASPAEESEVLYCSTVLEPLKAGETVSTIVSEQCSTKESDVIEPQWTLLLRAYADIDYGWIHGYQNYYGTGGPCDTLGYGIPVLGSIIDNKTSSFIGYNNCNTVAGHDHQYYWGTEHTWRNCGNSNIYVPWVGHMNDIISSFKVWRCIGY